MRNHCIPIPYYAAPESLPCSIPSLAEIQNSEELLCDQTGRKVVGVGEHFVVKYGNNVNLEEGRVMLYISQNASAPVPKVYALFQDPEGHKNYIIMERIQGQTLQGAWSSLTDAQKSVITEKLKVAFDELRRLPSPGGYCGLDNRPLPDDLFWNCCIGPTSKQDGPFETEESLNQAIIKRYDLQHPRRKSSLYKRVFPIIFTGHPPVFSHSDLQRKNIMITSTMAQSLSSGTSNDIHITIIDWEFAGWYPSYWEYTRALFACGRFDDDWNCWIDHILEPYLNEYSWMNTLMLELWT